MTHYQHVFRSGRGAALTGCERRPPYHPADERHGWWLSGYDGVTEWDRSAYRITVALMGAA